MGEVRYETLRCGACDRTWARPVRRGAKPARCVNCRARLRSDNTRRDELPEHLVALLADATVLSEQVALAGSDEALAEQLGVTRSQVGHARRRLGIPAAGRRGPGIPERAASLRDNPATLTAALDRAGSDSALAEQIGVSREAVGNWRRKHGIQVPPRTRPNVVSGDAVKLRDDQIAMSEAVLEHGSDQAVARSVGVSAATVLKWRQAHGILPGFGQRTAAQPEAVLDADALREDASVMEAALRRFGSDAGVAAAARIGESTLRRWRNALGVKPFGLRGRAGWIDELRTDREALIAALDKHGSDSALARAAGVSVSTVGSWRRSFGVTRRTRRSPEPGRSLAEVRPDLVLYWDGDRNERPPSEQFPYTLERVWWRCPSIADHRFEAQVARVVRGDEFRCPLCPGRPAPGRSLAEVRPDLVQEWDLQANIWAPDEVPATTDKVDVVWHCPTVSEHRYTMTPRDRVKRDGCPLCSHLQFDPGKSVAVVAPHLIAQWDFVKNEVGPDRVSAGSVDRYWWICPEGHEFKAAVGPRVRRDVGCAKCRAAGTSAVEQVIVSELRSFLPDFTEDAVRVLVPGETDGRRHPTVDTAHKTRQLAVEYDGAYFHGRAHAHERDIRKNRRLETAGWTVIRIRPEPLRSTSRLDVIGRREPDTATDAQRIVPLVAETVRRICAVLREPVPDVEHYERVGEFNKPLAALRIARELPRLRRRVVTLGR